MSDPVRYVVLSESDNQHHVAVARETPTTGWVQIIATFARKDRAEDYADIENQMAYDEPDTHGINFREEDHEQPPVIDEPQSGAGRVVEMIERSRETTRMVSYTAATGKPRPAGALLNEIMSELPSLLEEHPKGPTARIIAERLCVEEHWVRRALRELRHDGRARYEKRRDSSACHLTPLDYEPPEEELTATQETVLQSMHALADEDGIVSVAKRQIAIHARCAIPSVQQVLDSLERKGRVIGLERVHGSQIPVKYQIVQPALPEDAAA